MNLHKKKIKSLLGNGGKQDSLFDEKYTDGAKGELVYIHIGKCGGSTLWRAINSSPVVKDKFTSVRKVHIRKPYYQKNIQYIIVLRNPINRAISAFNWRYKLVVDCKEQEFRFCGEYEILKKYGTLSNFAETLYDNDVLNLRSVKEWQNVHHLKEDIDFYLSGILENLSASQIFSVLVQECLNDDMQRFLSIDQTSSVHENRSSTPDEMLRLSTVAYKNLKKFLKSDYDVIEKVNDMHPLGQDRLEILLR